MSAASVLFALFLAEAALRVAGYGYPVFYTTDAERGYALRPGAEGWYRKEGAAFVRVNSEGLRDGEHAREKPAGALRVAVLGDSYAEALQVEQEEAFWSVMEKRLAACGAFAGRPVEVINFGVSGYGTAQELITLRRKVWDYAPDLVLLAVTTNNDITDNSRALKKTGEIPYFVRREGGLALDDSFRETAAFRLRDSGLNRAGRWIRDNSRVIQLIHQSHGAIKTVVKSAREPRDGGPTQTAAATTSADAKEATRDRAEARGETLKAEEAAARSDELGTDNLVYRPPVDGAWEEAWRVTEDLIVLMSEEVRARGARFVVVTLSNGIQVYPDESARRQFMRRVGATDLFYPDLRIKSLGERAGFEVVNLAPPLQRYADERKLFLHGFGDDLGNGHWNRDGHRAAGELLAETLCAPRQ
ncbi:MAG TPA: SGNH/GDSL hydrolase family protein [Pyrinomonadaceae bacterium]|nr:SGNH/GDSL hydrolase family protein [Pyrinomonadaceae bacterium]